MKINNLTSRLLPIVLSVALILGTGFSASASNNNVVNHLDTVPEVDVLSNGESWTTYEINVPWESLHIEEVELEGRAYVRVSMEGWGQTVEAAKPELPVSVAQLGVPLGAEVSVEVLPGDAHTLTLSAPVLPGVTQVAEWGLPGEEDGVMLPEIVEVYEEDAAVYGGGQEYPGVLAEVSGDGMLRQQRVVGVSVYPVQYNAAAGELTVYETMTVTVRFSGDVSVDKFELGGDSEAYEQLLSKQLLNYEAARGYRESMEALPSLQVEGSSVDGAVDGITPETLVPWAPPEPGWRVKVQESGMYQLTYAELAGKLPVDTLDPQTLRMYNLGEEIAIEVVGEGDGSFDVGDYIVFYGEGIESKYTRDNVYWLTYGNGAGLRMGTRDGTPGGAGAAVSFVVREKKEQNLTYLSYLPAGEVLVENWLGEYLYPPSIASKSYTFTLAAPYDGSGTLTLVMLGNRNSTTANPDHHVVVKVNGTEYGNVKWEGKAWKRLEMELPAGVLVAGSNTVVVSCPADTYVTYDLLYVDRLELSYTSRFVATNNELAFNGAAGTRKFTVGGFTAAPIGVYDVTDAGSPVKLTGSMINTTSAIFQDTVVEETRYLAASSYHTEKAIEADVASNLRSVANGADHILITHAAFTAAANTLRNYRAALGLRALVVDVQNVYDEFSYGIVSPEAIHDFLAYTYGSWQAPAPSYVVLLGDGHYDPKNYLEKGRESYIPPYLLNVDPIKGETAADNRYVTLVGNDRVPDMMLGRLAVNSVVEADAFVNKIIAYQQTPVVGSWQQQVLAVADNADGSGNFPFISDQLLAAELPYPYVAAKIYYSGSTSDAEKIAARTAIVNAINAGKLLVNYIGHGSTTGWADESIFHTGLVPSLANGSMQPIFLTMDCNDGYYIYPYPLNENWEALAEVVTRADGKGAVASWSPTGEGVASLHDYLNRGFFRSFFTDQVNTIGKATTAGKLALFAIAPSSELLDTYLLFGDPAMGSTLKPTAVDLLDFKAEFGKKSVILSWETASEQDLVGFNIYRSRTKDGAKKLITPQLIPAQNPGTLDGAIYTFKDKSVKADRKYFYWLESVDVNGQTTLHGPVKVKTVSN